MAFIMRDTILLIDSFSSKLGQIKLTLSLNNKDMVLRQDNVGDRKILETNAELKCIYIGSSSFAGEKQLRRKNYHVKDLVRYKNTL